MDVESIGPKGTIYFLNHLSVDTDVGVLGSEKGEWEVQLHWAFSW